MTEAVDDARFEFGENWKRFLQVLDDDRILAAEQSLRDMLGVESLEGLKFLDVGSGSGLFSLAARRLGAQVRSFDYDPQSVECTSLLRSRYFPDDDRWVVEQGSILDSDYVSSLGAHDVVYSWGVLHHTGDMNGALDNVVELVRPGGMLFIAIYNDQGPASDRWRSIKRRYSSSGRPVQEGLVIGVAGYLAAKGVVARVLNRSHRSSRSEGANPKRGMSRWHDLRDWVGGYPFEVAKPEEILDRYRTRGFTLRRLVTCGGQMGCNEFVFVRDQ